MDVFIGNSSCDAKTDARPSERVTFHAFVADSAEVCCVTYVVGTKQVAPLKDWPTVTLGELRAWLKAKTESAEAAEAKQLADAADAARVAALGASRVPEPEPNPLHGILDDGLAVTGGPEYRAQPREYLADAPAPCGHYVVTSGCPDCTRVELAKRAARVTASGVAVESVTAPVTPAVEPSADDDNDDRISY